MRERSRGRGRAPWLVTLATAAWAVPACSDWHGEELVDGFHGYPWGTRYTEIAEIAGADPAGEREGLVIYSADVTFLGQEALAGFYFHPRTGRLVEGSYVFALSIDECDREWARQVRKVEEGFPGLVRHERLPSYSRADRTRYASDCEYYVFNWENEDWATTFVNPEPPHDRVGLWLRVIGRSVRLTVYYRGGAGQAWEDGSKRKPLLRGVPRFDPGAVPSPLPAPPPAPPAPPEDELLPFGRA